MLAYAVFFGWLSLSRYWAYEMHALDMGNMGQAAWNTIHGHPFQFTNMRLPYHGIEAWGTTTRLSFHVEFLFPLISLVYLIHPYPESLLVLQTVVLALGAVPVYLLARDVLAEEWLALLYAFVYLLFPALEALNLYEFHPVSLATPLLLFAFLFARRRQYLPFAFCCAAAMGTKEQIGLTVAMFGIYVAIVNRNWRIGLGTAVVGVFWSVAAVTVIEHHYRQPGTRSYIQARYGYLGHGLRGAIHTVFHDPLVVARVIFTWPKLGYLIRLLAPVGFLALLAPLVLLLGTPTLVLNLLSTDFHMYSGLGDNSAELIAVVMIAAILGTRWLLDALRYWMPRRSASLLTASIILLASLWNQHENGFSPIGNLFQVPSIGRHQHLADKFIAMIPPSAPVSTQDELDPHLSSRRGLYLFEDTGRRMNTLPAYAPADYILLDVSAPTYPLPSYQLHDRAEKWIHTRGWGVAAASDGLILIRRGAPTRSIPSGFYSYASADHTPIAHPLHGHADGLDLLGYDIRQTDLPNHYVPNLAYTIFLRPARRLTRDIQPVVFELMGRNPIGCAREPLGLAWLPTSHWKAGHRYQVRMDTLETDEQTPGTAHLFVGFTPIGNYLHPDCAHLWPKHGPLWPVGTLNVSF